MHLLGVYTGRLEEIKGFWEIWLKNGTCKGTNKALYSFCVGMRNSFQLLVGLAILSFGTLACEAACFRIEQEFFTFMESA